MLHVFWAVTLFALCTCSHKREGCSFYHFFYLCGLHLWDPCGSSGLKWWDPLLMGERPIRCANRVSRVWIRPIFFFFYLSPCRMWHDPRARWATCEIFSIVDLHICNVTAFSIQRKVVQPYIHRVVDICICLKNTVSLWCGHTFVIKFRVRLDRMCIKISNSMFVNIIYPTGYFIT